MSNKEFVRVIDMTLGDLERMLERLNKFGDGSSLGEYSGRYRGVGKALLLIDSHLRDLKLEIAQGVVKK